MSSAPELMAKMPNRPSLFRVSESCSDSNVVSEAMSGPELDYLCEEGIVTGCYVCEQYHPGRWFTISDVDSSLDEMRHPSREY